MLLRLIQSGSLIWEKEFGNAGYNLEMDVETPDGNYVIAGTFKF